jgi:uncharacterized protein (DUF1697 family)
MSWERKSQMRYIALLRGINVGGHQVKMERLRSHFAAIGLANARTYIQSGNVFFDSDETDEAALTQRIQSHLRASLGYEVPTCLRTLAQLEQTLALDPFKGETVTDDMRLNIVFAVEPIIPRLAFPIWSPKRDMEIRAATEREAFVVWYLKDGRASAGNFIDKTLGSPVTSRFLHTTFKILEAAKAE